MVVCSNVVVNMGEKQGFGC